MIAPAAFSLATIVASSVGTYPLSAIDPKLVGDALGLGLVLDRDRDAVERAAQLAGLAQGGVERGPLR